MASIPPSIGMRCPICWQHLFLEKDNGPCIVTISCGHCAHKRCYTTYVQKRGTTHTPCFICGNDVTGIQQLYLAEEELGDDDRKPSAVVRHPSGTATTTTPLPNFAASGPLSLPDDMNRNGQTLAVSAAMQSFASARTQPEAVLWSNRVHTQPVANRKKKRRLLNRSSSAGTAGSYTLTRRSSRRIVKRLTYTEYVDGDKTFVIPNSDSDDGDDDDDGIILDDTTSDDDHDAARATSA